MTEVPLVGPLGAQGYQSCEPGLGNRKTDGELEGPANQFFFGVGPSWPVREARGELGAQIKRAITDAHIGRATPSSRRQPPLNQSAYSWYSAPAAHMASADPGDDNHVRYTWTLEQVVFEFPVVLQLVCAVVHECEHSVVSASLLEVARDVC